MSTLAKSIKKCSGFCVPLIIYIIFAIIGLLSSLYMVINPNDEKLFKNTQTKVLMISIELIINIIVGGLMYWLCSKCYNVVAWIILLFPIIFGILFLGIMLIGIFALANEMNKKKL